MEATITSERLTKAFKDAHKAIEKPETWCQGAYARDAKGRSVNLYDPLATKFDGYTALARACNDDDLHHEALRIVHDLIKEAGEQRPRTQDEGRQIAKCDDVSLAIYNDKHAHDEVLSLLVKARERSKHWKEEDHETKNRKRPASRNQSSSQGAGA